MREGFPDLPLFAFTAPRLFVEHLLPDYKHYEDRDRYLILQVTVAPTCSTIPGMKSVLNQYL